MKNKYLVYVKNAGIATGVAILTGVGMSELASHFTDSGRVIGAISTVSQYLTWFGTFIPLHARDNRDVYNLDDKFNWKQFFKDQAKFAGSFGVLDIAYIFSRPFLQAYFMRKGIEAGKASLATDCFFVPAYVVSSFPLARLTGIIRKKKNLEEKTEE